MKVMVAMSGGVDSSAAAALLVRDGHEVVGVTLRLWGGESDTGCCSVADVDDARRVAQQLGIDHVVFNFTEDFEQHVVDPYVLAHAGGTTPNPCVECNRRVKFARLAERAALLGFDAVATGHHARIQRRDARPLALRRGADRTKDQSYVVHMLGQDDLARTLFPVGDVAGGKAEVRRLAGQLGLRTAAKPDSQDVCFITTADGRRDFLTKRMELHPGRVVDTAGRTVGEVEAIELVTLGQRRGLGLTESGRKRYVVAIDRVTSTVVVGADADLDVMDLRVDSVTWTDDPIAGDVLVQTSAHGATHAAYVEIDARAVKVNWRRPQRRVAPGQSIVFYDRTDQYVLGGGVASG